MRKSFVLLKNRRGLRPYSQRANGARGWRNHSLHGMYGAIRHWAKGSPHRVAFMLAELAVHFGVIDQVREHATCTRTHARGHSRTHARAHARAHARTHARRARAPWQVAERLKLKLTAEQVKQANTDRVIVNSLKTALQQLKQCRSAAERIDFGVVLAAAAPKRETPGAHCPRNLPLISRTPLRSPATPL